MALAFKERLVLFVDKAAVVSELSMPLREGDELDFGLGTPLYNVDEADVVSELLMPLIKDDELDIERRMSL